MRSTQHTGDLLWFYTASWHLSGTSAVTIFSIVSRLRTLPNALCCLPGNDLRQHFQDVRGQSAQVFGEAHETWRQRDGLPMQQHLVGSADGGTHPCVGQPKARFGNLLHPFLHIAHRVRIFILDMLAVLMVKLNPVLASPKLVLATFFTLSYRQRTQLHSELAFHTCWLYRMSDTAQKKLAQ